MNIWQFADFASSAVACAVSRIDATALFLITLTIIYVASRMKPPGLAWTYVWLIASGIGFVSANKEACALAFIWGLGLNTGWYASQLAHKDVWPNLLPFWHGYFPTSCVSVVVRVGDLLLHPIPMFFLLPYWTYATVEMALYAFIAERFYFWCTEHKVVGTGRMMNEIYKFEPHLTSEPFVTCQILCAVMYMYAALSAQGSKVHTVLLFFTLVSLVMVILTRTDREVPAPLKVIPTENIALQAERLRTEMSKAMQTVMSSVTLAQPVREGMLNVAATLTDLRNNATITLPNLRGDLFIAAFSSNRGFACINPFGITVSEFIRKSAFCNLNYPIDMFITHSSSTFSPMSIYWSRMTSSGSQVFSLWTVTAHNVYRVILHYLEKNQPAREFKISSTGGIHSLRRSHSLPDIGRRMCHLHKV